MSGTWARWLAFTTFAAFAAACSSSSVDRPCESQEDCLGGEICLDGFCAPVHDADGDADVDADSDADSDSDSDADSDSDSDAPPPLDFPDTDGDGISDLHEGLGAVDTDEDGAPDTEDDDSDADGVSDADEAGDEDPRTPPRDTDGDGAPDFRDHDADGDGILDASEGVDDPDGDGIPSFLDSDSDGDGIGDVFEGESDPDGDGIPSYLDDDSDGDGVDDEIEAGNGDPEREPPDSDGDDVYDFLDLDSDEDTIPDSVEGSGDRDEDGLPSFRDPDADGDGVPDWLEAGDEDTTTPPINSDADPDEDYLDSDSDGDTIADSHEYIFDTDGDGTPDGRDLDSDDDGLSDGAEAGDADASTPPVDTDSDGLPDFRDADSDNDGLSDHREAFEVFTDPHDFDTDGDEVSDLIELEAGTDPRDAADNPRARGDFVFLEPYMAPPDPEEDTLTFSTDIQMADVYFLMDTTASMDDEIANLQASLTGSVIPGIRDAIPDVWFGVGRFDDYPNNTYGFWEVILSGYLFLCYDTPFENMQYMTASTAVAQTAVNSLELHCGADEPESDIPALHAIATGCGDGTGYMATPNDPGGSCSNPGLIGYPHFRAGAVPIIVLLTDAPFHNGPGGENYGSISGVTPPTYHQTTAALNAIHARVIGVNSGTARSDLVAVANATGTVGAGGALVYDISPDGTGLGAQVVDAVEDLADSVPMDITVVPVDSPSDAVDAVAAFVDRVVPNTTAGAPCTPGLTTADHDGDGIPDTFLGVTPGTMVCFDVIPKQNETVEPTPDPQTFLATIQVWGDRVTVLDERDVYFLVPPYVPGGQ